MKQYLIVLMMLVIQAATPAPRWSAYAAADDHGDIKQYTKGDSSPTNKPTPAPDVQSPQKNEDPGKDKPYADKSGESVRVIEFPVVSVRTGPSEIVYLIFSALLVIVSGVLAFFLFRTLKAIKEQREIANKTLVLQYRPRIAIKFARGADFNVNDLGNPILGKISFKVVNFGGSNAVIIGGDFSLWSFCDRGPTIYGIEHKKGKPIEIETFILAPGERRDVDELLDIGTINDLEWANYFAGVNPGDARHIYLVGMVRYIDELNIQRQTGIFRIYKPKTGFFEAENSEREYID